ncbi:amidohydrolase family protein [Belliella kenyensis]|uniref:Amidohydrolase family protein n=1 Tax=Belliella kenyensis TaxID=1472724 RepID=A0ABV8EQM1_9BACT|nr:amidohydrolase family protein [Belliella kenyensis]MCH7403789.1 amidohydrolase family protein [Belliella kenyensis]MDN3602427.1 amidohydrolase family protein [Belliella kenyensis]
MLLTAFLTIIFVLISRVSFSQNELDGKIVINNVKVYNPKNGMSPILQSVTIENGIIESIKPLEIGNENVESVDGKGCVLIPGLIDVHVHMSFGALSMREMMSPMLSEGLIMRKVGGNAEKMLLRGFTSVRDAGGPIFPLKKAIDEGKLTGPRIWPSGATISQTAGHGDFRTPDESSRKFFGEPSRAERFNATFIADGRPEVLTAVRENLRFGASQIKLMAGGGTSSAYDPVDVTQYTFDEMLAAVEAAEDWGTYVMVHAYTPRAVQRAIKAGVKCVEHGQMLDQKTLRMMKKNNVWLSTQNLVESTPDMDPMRVEKRKPVIEGQEQLWPLAKKMKLKIAWGTDFLFEPELNEQQNAYILRLQKWFTNAEILKMITQDNAELLQLSGLRSPYPGKLGIIEEGALADLILVDGNPLEDLTLIAKPEEKFLLIMKEGRIYKNILN